MWEAILEILKSINWTSVITTLLMILAPLILEVFTGIFRAIVKFLQTHAENNFYLRFLTDVAEVMSAIWQQEAEALKADYADGVITEEEWKAHGVRLKKLAVEKIVERLKKYPEAFREAFGKRVEDAVESWLERNKRVQTMMQYMKNVKNPVGVDMNKLIDGASDPAAVDVVSDPAVMIESEKAPAA